MGLDISHYRPVVKSDDFQDYFTKDELGANPEYLKNFEHLLTVHKIDPEFDSFLVIYLEEIGYVRKQMNANFCKIFENGRLYFTVEDVINASTFLEAKQGGSMNDQELQEYFSTNFIDNFIEGESIFCASW